MSGARLTTSGDVQLASDESGFIPSLPTLTGSNPSESVDKRQLRMNPKHRVSIACTGCRSQHLRCDATMPTCSRCIATNKRCVYTSLRSRRCKTQRVVTSLPEIDFESMDKDLCAGVSVTDSSTLRGTLPLTVEPPIRSPTEEIELFLSGSSMLMSSHSEDFLIEEFYTHFYPSHPFLLPKLDMAQQKMNYPESVRQLLPIIKLIGTRYTETNQTGYYRAEADASMSKNSAKTGFTVQALLLFALFQEWSGEGEGAASTLQDARDTALEIGMQFKNFFCEGCRRTEALEESWRRTWWELYVIDALFAGVRHLTTFPLWKIDMSTYLPNDDKIYRDEVSAS